MPDIQQQMVPEIHETEIDEWITIRNFSLTIKLKNEHLKRLYNIKYL